MGLCLYMLTLIFGFLILWYEEEFCVSEHSLIPKKEQELFVFDNDKQVKRIWYPQHQYQKLPFIKLWILTEVPPLGQIKIYLQT